MKNNRYYPHERNNYYYGKLITVRDFETEQQYFNDKRRLINRLMFGSGVVCGLRVIAVDDKTISIETEVVLDYTGREIVVASPVTKKLSMIEGFTSNEYAKDVYLMIAYSEAGKEPVHSVSSSTKNEEITEFNRIKESFRIYINEEAPKRTDAGNKDALYEIQIVYTDPNIKIWQKTPKNVRPGEVFEISVMIEKTLQTKKLNIEYELESNFCKSIDSDDCLKIVFEEGDTSDKTEYEYRILAKANTDNNITDKIKIKNGKIKVKIGQNETEENSNYESNININNYATKEKIIRDYLNRSLDECLEAPADAGICIAKISLVKVGPTYLIEKVKEVPFGEYVYNSSSLMKIDESGMKFSNKLFKTSVRTSQLPVGSVPEAYVNFSSESNLFDFEFGIPDAKSVFSDITTGIIELKIDNTIRAKKTIYSDLIEHGLGPGPVFIKTGLELEDEDDTITRFGNLIVFKEEDVEKNVPNVVLGAEAYEKAGVFKVGAIVRGLVKESKIKVRWWAYKRLVEVKQKQGINIFFTNDILNVNAGKSIKIKPIITGTDYKEVNWFIKELSGGKITEDGLYTAPEKKGIFTIIATCKADETKKAIIYVFVNK